MAVEFAITSALFFLLLFGIIEGGRAIWIYNTMAHAASEGARFAMVRSSQSGNQANVETIRTHVLGKVAGISNVTVDPIWSGGNVPGSTISVTVSHQFSPILPVPFSSLNLSKTSKMTIVN
jgi:Flp pilus assembly protein TadG